MNRIRKAAALFTGLLVAAGAVPAFPAGAEELPESFDLRTKGLVSSVKDQINYETSWAFSALSSIETGEMAADPFVDLSEWHLAYYTYSNQFGYLYSTDNLFNAGTYDAQQETGILTSWIGPVSEDKAEIYGDESITDSMLTMDEVRAQAEYHVTDAVNLEYQVTENRDDAAFAAQRDAVKQYVYGGEAVDVSFLYRSECFDREHASYYYQDAAGEKNWHSVSIVGWDDSFPASAFASDPGMDGAWLCKDSYGPSWGNDGYIWLSYADTSMDDVYVIRAESAGAHDRLYQHDDFGNSGRFAADRENGDTSVMAANVFTAQEDGWIDSLMFCNVSRGTDAEFTVYTGLADPGNPVSGTAQTTVSTRFPEKGYQTVTLETPVALEKGEQFAIVAKLSGTQADSRIPCEFATRTEITHPDGSNDVSDSVFSMEMLERDFTEGQSFYSTDGTYWYDMYHVEPLTDTSGDADAGDTTETTMKAGNICMKAVTRDVGTVVFSDYHESILPDAKITLSNDDQAPIYYTLDGVNWELYQEPIGFPEGAVEMEISAYADLEIVAKGEEKTIFSRHYSVRASAVSSLLCKNAGDNDYAVPDPADPKHLRYAVPSGTKTLELVPMTAGTVTVDGKTYASGQTIPVSLTGSSTGITLTAQEEGLAPTTYTLTVGTFGGEEPEYTLGDVNADGEVNSVDASLILVAAASFGLHGTTGLEAWQEAAGNVNADDAVDAVDASIVLTYASSAGLGGGSRLEDFIP